MVSIIFKNVGQGDSIIIEWLDNGNRKIGIVDSHIYFNRNPVLEHLRAHNYKSIDFYILSHGHYDHFSGISSVLEYCAQKKIIIKTFYHTLSGTIVKIYSTFKSNQKAKAAERLVLDLERFTKGSKSLIEKIIQIDCDRPSIMLNNDIKIEILSPNGRDFLDLEKSIGDYISDKISHSPNLNRVSTILKVTKENEFILLTSDSLRSRIGRIKKFLDGDVMLLGQVPHHGSSNNHRKKFWEQVIRVENCIAVFSTGNNPSDNLPDKKPVEDISNLKYKIHSTNQVNGLVSVFGTPEHKSSSTVVISDLLDMFSTSENTTELYPLEDDLNGDQSFSFWES